MNYKIEYIDTFEKQLRKLLKKYPSLKNDLSDLVASLKSNPLQGTSLGNDFYKIRLAITSKSKGKSGGARVIVSVKITRQVVYFAAIFDKSDQASISDKELKWLSEMISQM